MSGTRPGDEAAASPREERSGSSSSLTYQTLRHLATGGMADLYLAAVQGIEGFQKLVVLKRMRRELAELSEMVESFLDEVRLAATLHHPNIVQVYDIGHDEGDYFYSMEYVAGADLRAVMLRAQQRSRDLSLDEAVTMVIQACAGLHHAHEKRDRDGHLLELIHRDVSPQNILISYDGAVKVTDFGIAKATSRVGHTAHGGLKGKLRYMAPEALCGKPLDRRYDVFGLGVVLYELTTSRMLFVGENDFDTMRRVLEERIVPPDELRPSFPPELSRIVMKALARATGERYPTALALQLDLEAFARQERLAVSSVTIERMMSQLFPERVDGWRNAQRLGLAPGTPPSGTSRLDGQRLRRAARSAAQLGGGFAEPLPDTTGAGLGEKVPATAVPERASLVQKGKVALLARLNQRHTLIVSGVLAAAAVVITGNSTLRERAAVVTPLAPRPAAASGPPLATSVPLAVAANVAALPVVSTQSATVEPAPVHAEAGATSGPTLRAPDEEVPPMPLRAAHRSAHHEQRRVARHRGAEAAPNEAPRAAEPADIDWNRPLQAPPRGAARRALDHDNDPFAGATK